MIELAGLKIQENAYVSDWTTVRRTWRERLFTRPWRPWKKWTTKFEPRGLYFQETGLVLVSYQSYLKILHSSILPSWLDHLKTSEKSQQKPSMSGSQTNPSKS